MPSFDLNDKKNISIKKAGAVSRLASFKSPAVPRDVKVLCNRPKRLEAICWKNPTFFEPPKQKPASDSMMNQTDDSTMTHSVDIQNPYADDASGLFVDDWSDGVSGLFVDESSDGTSHPSVDESSCGTSPLSVDESSGGASHPCVNESSGGASSSSGAMDSSIRYVDDIIIECGNKISYDKKDKNPKSQMATHITTIRAMEAPISESIYAPPKFETNINTMRLGKKAAWASIPQHSFLALRYTTYEPSSKTFRRKRAVMGLYGNNKRSDLIDDSNTLQTIGTQSDISYDRLINVMKSIPKYLSDNSKFKMIRGRFKKANNCNSFVYSMAKQAGLSDIAELHHTISPGSAAENILDYMSQDGSDLSRVRVEFDGTKNKLMRRPIFVQEKGVVSLGLQEDEFLTEARQIMEENASEHSQDSNILSSLKMINWIITSMIEIIKPLPWLDNKDDRVARVQALFPLLTMIDSNILKAVKLASGKHKMLQVYLMGIQDFFHTVRNELGFRSHSASDEFSAPNQEDPLDFETSYSFEHRPSAQTAFYFKNLLNDASFKNYTKDILKFSQKDIAYNDKLSCLTFIKNTERLRNAGHTKANSKTLAEQKSNQQYLEQMDKDIKIQANVLNNIILGNYESDFTTLIKKLKNRNPKQPIDATDTYYRILKLYQTALKNPQNQRNLADYIDLYQSITFTISMKSAIDNIVNHLQYHLQLTLLNTGVTPQRELQKMFSFRDPVGVKKREDFLHKDLDTVEEDVQTALDTKERQAGTEGFNRQTEHISLLASNAKTIFYSMIYHAVQATKQKNTK